MFNAEFQPDTDILDAYSDRAIKAPALLRTGYRRTSQRTLSRLEDALQEEPDTPKYPLRWKSVRQRRFVMAMLWRTGNLPYTRTHRLSRGWKVTLEDSEYEGAIMAKNPSPITRYVEGDDQQPYHQDSQWLHAPSVIDEYRDVLNDRLIETWYTVVGVRAGVPD